MGPILTALLAAAPPSGPATPISPTEEDAVHLRVDSVSGQALWEAVGMETRAVRAWDLARRRMVKPARAIEAAARGPWPTKRPRRLLLNLLGEDGRWSVRIAGKEPASPSAASDLHGAISPDRKLVAFVSGRSGKGDVYATSASKNNQSPLRLSSSDLPDVTPAWSPDSHSLAFLRLTDRGRQLIVLSGVQGKDGRRERVAADEREGPLYVSWRPDGKQIGFYGRDWSVGSALYLVDPEMGGSSKTLGDVEPQWSGPAWLPDGRGGWLVLAVRHGDIVAVDALGEQTVLQTGAFGHSEVAAALIKGKRVVVFTALGLRSDDALNPRYRRVYRWVWTPEPDEDGAP